MTIGRMISNDLLEILRCPVTGQRLKPAPPEIISRLASERNAGRLRDHAGNPISEPVEHGLLREDGKVFYPIRDGIPVMLPEESIEI